MAMTTDIWTPWIIIPLAAVYIWTCFRIGMTASQYGRRLWVWFMISLFFTAIPAAIFLWFDYFRLKRQQQEEEDAEEFENEQEESTAQPAAESVPASAPAQPAAKETPAPSSPAPAAAPSPAKPPQPAAEDETGETTLLPEHAIVCPSCHSILQPGQTARIGGVLKCLKCGLPIDEIKLA